MSPARAHCWEGGLQATDPTLFFATSRSNTDPIKRGLRGGCSFPNATESRFAHRTEQQGIKRGSLDREKRPMPAPTNNKITADAARTTQHISVHTTYRNYPTSTQPDRSPNHPHAGTRHTPQS